jgi:hypothetical protein
VRLWDLRRLIVPLTHFIEKPFTGFIYVDYTLPVKTVRAGLQRILPEPKPWNGKTCILQVTEFTESTVQLRCLMSANSSSIAFDLRGYLCEQMIKFLQDNYPRSACRLAATPSPYNRSTLPSPKSFNRRCSCGFFATARKAPG